MEIPASALFYLVKTNDRIITRSMGETCTRLLVSARATALRVVAGRGRRACAVACECESRRVALLAADAAYRGVCSCCVARRAS